MTDQKQYNELLYFCDGAQNKRDIQGWQTLHEFDEMWNNKDLSFQIYKNNNKIVIAFAGTDLHNSNDLLNDKNILFSKNIPSQYGMAEYLYNSIRAKYPNFDIESVGYSLGGTLSNLLAHRTGIKSTAIAPIGSRHIVEAHPEYFKFGNENIKTYGRKKDRLFYDNIDKQSGRIYIVPDLPKDLYKEFASQHLLHYYSPYDIYKAQLYKKTSQNDLNGFASIKPTKTDSYIFTPDKIGKMSQEEFAVNKATIINQLKNGLIKKIRPVINYSGYANPINGQGHIYTREDIASMNLNEYEKVEQVINSQLKSIGIPTNNEMYSASYSGRGVVYVKPYIRKDGTPVNGYYRSN